MITAAQLGHQLAYYRKQRGFSLRDMFHKTGLSIGFLSDMERGRSMPTVETAEKIAAAFDMTLVEWFGGATLDLTPDERAMLNTYRAGDLEQAMRLMLQRVQDILQEDL